MLLKPMPGFHMIIRISGDTRIAQFCDQRLLRRNGDCLVQLASDRCVASDPCVKGKPMNFSDRGLSFKRYFFVIFYRHLRIGFWCQTSKMCAIVVINGNYMMQGSLIVAGHKFVRSLPDQRSLRSYENKAEQMDSPKICHCRILMRMQQYIKNRESPKICWRTTGLPYDL